MLAIHQPPVKYKRGKKRAAAKQPSPQECVHRLAGSNLHGVLFRGAVWLACTRQLAYFVAGPPGRYCSPRHPMHIESSFLELYGTP
jgi:hypothetical protein